MDSFDDTGADETYDTDEESPLEDTGWDWDHIAPGRNHIDALRDISEDDIPKDQESYEYPSSSGLEEAVQGWGRVSSLACIFQAQKKGKKPKNDDPDHHCLLCADMRPLSMESSARSHDHRCDSHTLDSGLTKSQNLLSSPSAGVYSHTAEAAPTKDDPEGNVQDLSLQQMLKELQLKASLQQLSPLQPHLDPAYSVLKDNKLVYSINMFTVLPPVKSTQQCSVHAVSGQSAAGKETSEANGSTYAGESRDAERRDETKARFVEKPDPPRDTCGANMASKYYICQHNHQLLSAYRTSMRQKCCVSLVPIVDSRSHNSFSMHRHLKQGLRYSSDYRRQTKQAMSDLPAIFGTKILMPVSAQRPL